MAKQVFGGECRFTLSTGVALTVRGDVSYDPSDVEIEGIVNQDGSIAGSATLTGYTAEWSFEDMPNDTWSQLMRARSFNASLIQDYAGPAGSQAGTRHIWTDCIFVGKPSVDRKTGEVSGVSTLARTLVKKS